MKQIKKYSSEFIFIKEEEFPSQLPWTGLWVFKNLSLLITKTYNKTVNGKLLAGGELFFLFDPSGWNSD